MSASRFQNTLLRTVVLVICVLVFCPCFRAQSLDARSPSPVRSNEIVGRIAARDLGDSRLTDHFYAFTGTPGDLLITIEAQNLNGDIDVFTAGSLRPVLKVALYAEAGLPVAKSVYLRQREDLILRVEARSPNDDDGIYHIRFGGSFEPIAGAVEAAEEANATPETPGQPRRGKRVSSVGARINEPPPPVEVAAAPTPEPTPAATPEEPKTELKAEAPAEKSPGSTAARSRPAPRRSSRSKTRTSEATATKTETEAVEPKTSEEANSPETAAAPGESEPAPKSNTSGKGRSSTRKSADVSKARESDSTPPEVRTSKRAPDVSKDSTEAHGEPKLIIEMMDGSRIERLMSEIRRVTLESGQIVVTGTDGNVERVRLARVLRMSIGQ
ncbi:MAG TPA: hypothetical protein VE135_05475 [Pyrinomonadaceae bacterium]|nr:hypothetical protein [Pyrinomonadaceae bacterium]